MHASGPLSSLFFAYFFLGSEERCRHWLKNEASICKEPYKASIYKNISQWDRWRV
jgi:hypothetical protein